jgi:transcriptional regulator with XRE-family HTH domain
VRQPAQKRAQNQVGANVRRRRLELGLSQEDLAAAAGVHPTMIGRLERGEREPRLHTIVAVGRALAVRPSDLLSGVK